MCLSVCLDEGPAGAWLMKVLGMLYHGDHAALCRPSSKPWTGLWLLPFVSISAFWPTTLFIYFFASGEEEML